MQHITVVPYDPAWPGLYEAEAQAIAGVLGQRLTAIHHIAARRCPGWLQSPSSTLCRWCGPSRRPMNAARISRRWATNIWASSAFRAARYLRKGGDERTHQMHIFASDDVHAIARHLAVRDYLRAHPARAAAYGALKLELAARFPYDIDGYCDGKDAFVGALERDALEWRAACDLKNGSNKA